MDANFAIGPINWQLELVQGVTDFYVYANFAMGPIDWQLDIRPRHHWVLRGHQLIDWWLESDQGVNELYVDTNFAIGPI